MGIRKVSSCKYENTKAYCHEQGSIKDFLFGGKVDPEKIFEPRGGEKKFFRPSKWVRGHGPLENFENIVFRIG